MSLETIAPWHAWHPDAGGSTGALRLGEGGLWCGAFRGGAPVVLDLFRAGSSTVAGVVDFPAAVVLALRARAAGAAVTVRDPSAAWRQVAAAAGPDRPITVDGDTGRPGTFARPRVVVDQADDAPPARLPPWTVRLALSARPDPRTLAGADVVLLSGLSPEQAELVGGEWPVEESLAAALRTVRRPWQLAIVTDRRYAVVDLLPQAWEKAVLLAAAASHDGTPRPAAAPDLGEDG